MKSITVSTIMSTTVSCTSADTPLSEIVQAMVDKRFSCAVITENNQPMGIITERDLVKVMQQATTNSRMLARPVSEFMSSPIVTLGADESLFDALVVSRAEKIRHLPVVDEQDNLVGLVTQSDLAEAHFHVIEIQSDMIERSIRAKTRDLQRINDELQALSMEDHLLEIGNRRSMEVDLEHTHSAMRRYQRHYSVILFDVDCFKLYNDHYGHTAGDEALKQVADYLKHQVRGSDRLYRYGGEELLLLLPETPADNALVLANRLVEGLFKQQIPHEKSQYKYLSMSAGVSCSDALSASTNDTASSWEDVAANSDAALYQAKESGRNRAQCYDAELKEHRAVG